MTRPVDEGMISFGGVRIRFGLAVLAHIALVLFSAGVIWTKLDNRISRLEEVVLHQDAQTSRKEASIESSVQRLGEKVDKLSEQIARIEGRLDEKR